jgi:hypothetical protein
MNIQHTFNNIMLYWECIKESLKLKLLINV